MRRVLRRDARVLRRGDLAGAEQTVRRAEEEAAAERGSGGSG